MRYFPILFLSAGLLALVPVVSSQAEPPTVRHTHGGIAYRVIDTHAGDTLVEGMLLLVDLELAAGNVEWHADSLVIAPGTVGTLELDQTGSPVTAPGFLWLEVCGDSLAQGVADGEFLSLLPPVGARLPLALPLSSQVTLDAARLGFAGREVEISFHKRIERAGEAGSVEAKQ